LPDCRRRSVVEWGIAEPSFNRDTDEPKTAEEEEKDRKWSAQQRRKQNILLSYNKVRGPSLPRSLRVGPAFAAPARQACYGT
jgi:hypothetical protein